MMICDADCRDDAEYEYSPHHVRYRYLLLQPFHTTPYHTTRTYTYYIIPLQNTAYRAYQPELLHHCPTPHCTAYTHRLQIVALLMNLNPAVIRVFNAVKKLTTSWSKYGSSYGLWATRKPDADKRLLEKAAPASFFEARLAGYGRLIAGVDAMALQRNIGFLRVDCYPVAMVFKEHAVNMQAQAADLLRQIARRKMESATARITALSEGLVSVPTDLASLKTVLTCIAQVCTWPLSMRMNGVPEESGLKALAFVAQVRFHCCTVCGYCVFAGAGLSVRDGVCPRRRR